MGARGCGGFMVRFQPITLQYDFHIAGLKAEFGPRLLDLARKRMLAFPAVIEGGPAVAAPATPRDFQRQSAIAE
jgi:hypothetical protein